MGYCYGLTGYGFNHLGGFWWLMPLLFWGLILTGVILLYRVIRKRSNNHQALDILKHEYARGRITREEFLNRKNDLQ